MMQAVVAHQESTQSCRSPLVSVCIYEWRHLGLPNRASNNILRDFEFDP